MTNTEYRRLTHWRLKLLEAALHAGNVARTCRHFGISRKTFYKGADVSMSTAAVAWPTVRELFGKLDITQLEELAAESEALVAKAKAMLSANARALTAFSPSPADFPPSRLASGPSSLPDVEVTDVTRGDAVASGDLQALVGGSIVLVQGNGMTSELTTAPRTPVGDGDTTAKPAETPTTTNIEEVRVPPGEP